MELGPENLILCFILLRGIKLVKLAAIYIKVRAEGWRTITSNQSRARSIHSKEMNCRWPKVYLRECKRHRSIVAWDTTTCCPGRNMVQEAGVAPESDWVPEAGVSPSCEWKHRCKTLASNILQNHPTGTSEISYWNGDITNFCLFVLHEIQMTKTQRCSVNSDQCPISNSDSSRHIRNYWLQWDLQ